MNKHSIAVLVGVSLAAVGQSAHAGPSSISLIDLDQITAGSASHHSGAPASGGAVVGNDSSATISALGKVTLDSEAQNSADALNAVNSSESTVANGLNIWQGVGDRDIDAPAEAVSSLKIEQLNEISQDQRRLASLPAYSRPGTNLEETWDKTGASVTSASHDETDIVTDVVDTSFMMDATSNASVDAKSIILEQEIMAGKGLAISGVVDTILTAGVITLGGDVNTGPLTGNVTFTLDLPELDVEAEGSGCAVTNASCVGDGTTYREDKSFTDKSTEYRLATSEAADEEYTDAGTRMERSAFEISHALAEYIVVDNSSLDVSTDYSVELSGAAQSMIQAMNLVNAAGSAVANGVNIARGDNHALLQQTNRIVHSR